MRIICKFFGHRKSNIWSESKCRQNNIVGGIFSPWECKRCGYKSKKIIWPRTRPRKIPNFGNSPAAKSLFKLTINTNQQKRVAKYLTEYYHEMYQSATIRDKKVAIKLIELLKTSMLQKISNDNTISIEVCSYLENLIITRYRVIKKHLEKKL